MVSKMGQMHRDEATPQQTRPHTKVLTDTSRTAATINPIAPVVHTRDVAHRAHSSLPL
jgi:hypothetical protein